MHKELGTMIRKADRLEDARRLFSELHGALHLSEVSGGAENELDRLTGDLEDPEYAVMVTSKDETIAWALWHIARLEDLTMNILVSGGEQVWNREWARRLGTAVALPCLSDSILSARENWMLPRWISRSLGH